MRYFAQIDTDLICRAINSSENEVIGDHVIEVTIQVESGTALEDFTWRKFENSVWSTDKFAPAITPPPSVSLEARIKALEDVQLANMLA